MRSSEFIVESNQSNPGIYYWSYGMLCDPNTMSANAQYVGPAKLQGYKLELLGHANIVPTQGSSMMGTLWLINNRVLRELDGVEGYPYYYTRVRRNVVHNGQSYRAQIYVMTDESRTRSLTRGPSSSYLDQIRAGYTHGKIPTAQLDIAIDEMKQRLRQTTTK